MYYLDQKVFKPAIILLSIPFIPSIIALIIASSMFFKAEVLIILCSILIVYFSIVIILFIVSRKKKHYLHVQDDKVKIMFNDVFTGETKLELYYSDIIRMTYYRINSIKGWLMLFSYIFPNCVYITYSTNGEEQTKFIGYMDFRDVKAITKSKDIELIIH